MALPVEILLIRLSAFGDILHTLPAAASLKRGIPGARLTWLVDPKWAPLLAGNPDVDEVLLFNRRESGSWLRIWRELRRRRFAKVVDAQGLLKSAALARAARLDRSTPNAGRFGFDWNEAREGLASAVYTNRLAAAPTHVVDKNLALAELAGASGRHVAFPLPAGKPEGELPAGPFVLAAPFAGWVAKQWPIGHYSRLAALLRPQGITLVCNVAPGDLAKLAGLDGVVAHSSGLDGLIDATRRATAVVGLDSGPLHLAAALGKPGVAIFGPTDPARNGPYGGTIKVLQQPGTAISYRRDAHPSAAMAAISPEQVFQALRECLAISSPNPTPTR